MEKILILMSEGENRKLLSNYLGARYKLINPCDFINPRCQYDLCICDGPTFNKYRNKIEARQFLDTEVFQPVLLVTAKSDINYLTSAVWQVCDEIINQPIQKKELLARIEILLRMRRLSLDMMAMKNKQLKEAQLSLAEQKEMFSVIVKSTPIATYSLNREGIVQTWNPAAEKMFGWSDSEVLGSPLPIIPDRFQTEYRELFNRILQGESIQGVELIRRRKDSAEIECNLYAAPLRDRKGTIIGVMAGIQDISRRKRIEEELISSEAKFRSLFENNHTIMIVISPEDGGIVEVNPAACEFYGRSREELLAMKMWDINTLSKEEIREEMKLAFENKYNIFRFRHRLSDGSEREVEVYSGPIRINGRHLLYSLVFDVTQKNMVERERQRLVTAISQIEEGIIITDTDGVIQYVNPAFEMTSGYSKAEVLGKTPRILNSGRHGKTFYVKMWETILGGNTWSGNIINRKKDGSLYTEQTTISPVKDEESRIMNFVATKKDMTEELNLQRQFLQAQKMESVGRLAGGVAHDYNNILSVILGYTHMAMESLGEDNPVHEDLKVIYEAGIKSRDITRQLLAFSRKQVAEPVILDLNETVEAMLKILRQLIGEDIELKWQPSKQSWKVRMDPVQIDQILANLCTNARDAIKDTGWISISTDIVAVTEKMLKNQADIIPGEYAVLSVCDSGYGMDEETVLNIFEPFFTTKESGKGTGLGLATVYGIVKQNKGIINVDSEPGKGTCFSIYLPRCLTEKESEIRQDTSNKPRGKGQGILIVEDDPLILNLAGRILTEHNYRVYKAALPNAAIALLRENRKEISLLVTDVIMPEMNGKQLADALRNIKPDLRIIFMSGYTSDLINEKDINIQDKRYLQKPFSSTDLAEKVSAIMGNS